jgi:serine/threonine protein kinase
MTPSATGFQPGDRFGKYRLIRVLAGGHAGAVYEAEHPTLHTKVAIRILAKNQTQRLRALIDREVRVLAALKHPNVVSVRDFGEEGSFLYTVLDYVDGPTLRELLNARAFPSITVPVRMAATLASTLGYLHHKGILHTDLHPSNVVVSTDGQPVICELDVWFNTSASVPYEADLVMGTPPYMSPEAVRGDWAAMSVRADVWSLGALMFEMLAGRAVYKGTDRKELGRKMTAPDPVDLSPLADKAPGYVVDVVGRCLAKDPAARYATADDLRRALEASIDRIETSEKNTVLLPPPNEGRTLLLHVEYQEPDLAGAYRQYEVGRYIGGGTYGDVFQARELLSGREVALKILRQQWVAEPEAVMRFRREATVLARLSHPNVVRVHNFGRYGASFFIAMDYLDGPSLVDVIADSAPMAVTAVSTCIGQLAAGLAAIHRVGAIHRDLKPANIRSVGTRFVILDFGIAHIREAATLTVSGERLGSPAYMSPEQALGLPCTSASDIYSLGVIMYEMLSGRRPHVCDAQEELLRRIVEESIEPIGRWRSDLTAGVTAIVDRMLSKDPQDRPSAEQVGTVFAPQANGV